MKFLILLFYLVLPVLNQTSQEKSGKIAGYDFSNPDNSWSLPDELREISGVVPYGASSFACVQDELGIVFIYDYVKKEIVNKIVFFGNGDYEDLTMVANSLVVLKSDGTLFLLPEMNSGKSGANIVRAGIPCGDNEGLCYDPVSKNLLIACKGAIRDEDIKDKRPVFSFNMKTRTSVPKPFLLIDPDKIESFLKKSLKENDIDINFRISAIAVHPLTRKIFVVSADDRLICVFNRNGILENAEILPKKLFKKTEGISFLPNGDLIMSNEGEDSNASILKFRYNPNWMK